MNLYFFYILNESPSLTLRVLFNQLEVSQSELDLYLYNQTQETNKLNEMTRKLEKCKERLAEKTKYVHGCCL